MKQPRRGEIYFLDFSSREMKGPHPALVIQNDIGNKVGSLTIVAAITSSLKVAELPVGVLIKSKESGLPYESVVHLGQLYTIDKERLDNFVAALPQHRLNEVDKAIAISLGLREFWQ